MAVPTAEELLSELLPRFCEGCGNDLPQPGEPCEACGHLPQITRAEARERLELPGAPAMLAAVRLRERVKRRAAENSADLREADALEHISGLQRTAAEAAAAVPPLREEVARLAGVLETTRDRERDAAEAEADSRRNFKRASDAYERAVRTRKDAAARTEALMRRNAAAPIAEADQAALREAAAGRQRAEAALTAAAGRLEAAEGRVRAAEAAVAGPGRAPLSVVSVALDLCTLATSADLTPEERALVRGFGRALAQVTGASADIAARAVELAAQDGERQAREAPGFLKPLRDGSVAVAANPFSPATPRQTGGTQPPPAAAPQIPGMTLRQGIPS